MDEILEMAPEVVGIYRLTMKSGSDNFRSSAIQDIILKLQEHGKRVAIFEPTLFGDEFEGIEVIHDLGEFKKMSSVILANRMEPEIEDVKDKVYTRDLWGRD